MFAQGHIKLKVGNRKRLPNELKIKAIQDFPVQKAKTQVISLLGLTGFYHNNTNHYATKEAS